MKRTPIYADPNANRSNESLINDLASSDLTTVHQVRESLTQRGNAAVPDILQALRNSNGQIQWGPRVRWRRFRIRLLRLCWLTH